MSVHRSWDPSLDTPLLGHKSTLNLLYLQTISEVERGWIKGDNETRSRLAQMQASGDKKLVRKKINRWLVSEN